MTHAWKSTALKSISVYFRCALQAFEVSSDWSCIYQVGLTDQMCKDFLKRTSDLLQKTSEWIYLDKNISGYLDICGYLDIWKYLFTSLLSLNCPSPRLKMSLNLTNWFMTRQQFWNRFVACQRTVHCHKWCSVQCCFWLDPFQVAA